MILLARLSPLILGKVKLYYVLLARKCMDHCLNLGGVLHIVDFLTDLFLFFINRVKTENQSLPYRKSLMGFSKVLLEFKVKELITCLKPFPEQSFRRTYPSSGASYSNLQIYQPK